MLTMPCGHGQGNEVEMKTLEVLKTPVITFSNGLVLKVWTTQVAAFVLGLLLG